MPQWLGCRGMRLPPLSNGLKNVQQRNYNPIRTQLEPNRTTQLQPNYKKTMVLAYSIKKRDFQESSFLIEHFKTIVFL